MDGLFIEIGHFCTSETGFNSTLGRGTWIIFSRQKILNNFRIIVGH